ncbi:ovomucoid-like isoform X2 [Suricata suricatta]|nr:ovomucoid-like isoform X2 [Suricata suricatta]
MSLLSPRITVFFIMVLVFPFYSGNASINPFYLESLSLCLLRDNPAPMCLRNYDPVCATNGKTYSNKCVFCIARKETGNKIHLAHYGKC